MIKRLILDVDGVLTSGQTIYSAAGKQYKVFGLHDRDGLKIMQDHNVAIDFITADASGFSITYARIVKDWGFADTQLHLVPEGTRLKWFENNCTFENTAFIGDGYHDAPILKKVAIGIAPNNARKEARAAANYVTESASGYGAVLDACLYLESVINGFEPI
mgnify:CR=1 FL=1|tara:strand:- start:543 stop:1025 length:483 start_codon:yes stop_codon:yes gene_type:complete